MDKVFFKNKKALIMGLGRFGGGADSAIFSSRAGAKVVVTDLCAEDDLKNSLDNLADYDIEYHLAGHTEDDFKTADIVIVNPAVPPDNKYIRIAAEAGKTITSQIEIFFQLCHSRIVAVTGANGKSTTTALTHHLLSAGASQPDTDFSTYGSAAISAPSRSCKYLTISKPKIS